MSRKCGDSVRVLCLHSDELDETFVVVSHVEYVHVCGAGDRLVHRRQCPTCLVAY